MFFPGSRYEKLETYLVTKPDGTLVSAVKFHVPSAEALRGFHRRHEGQRLDHLASHYLKDATAFWRLCDANEQMSPDALAAHELVGIPRQNR